MEISGKPDSPPPQKKGFNVNISLQFFSRSKSSPTMSSSTQAASSDDLCEDPRRQCDDQRHRDVGKTSRHSDNDSGCALEEYSWVPPGLKTEHVRNYKS
jgi:hypothetical protein